MNLYYLHYNNYYNRIIKKFDTLAEYLVLPYYDNVVTNNIAFNPNDGVTTKQVANIPINTFFTYDYCIYAEENNIISRWFIVDAKRNLNGQYTLNLKRDLFADSLDFVLDAPSFIEKATLNETDPLIFNSENMTFNQIKTSETLLKDNSGCPWVVGYLDKSVNVSGSVKYELPTPYTTKEIFDTDWNSLKSTNPNVGIMIPKDYKLIVHTKDSNQQRIDLNINLSGYNITDGSTFINTNLITSNPTLAAEYYFSNFEWLIEQAGSYYNYKTTEDANRILEYNGKIIKDENNRYYKVNIKTKSGNSLYNFIGPNSGSLYNNINYITQNNQYISGNDNLSDTYIWQTYYTEMTYTLTEVFAKEISYSINAANINQLQDAPYVMFAIPYGAMTFNITTGGETQTITIQESDGKSIAIAIAQDISQQLSGANAGLYDIQLLPYCPFQNELIDNGEITFDSVNYYNYVTSGGSNVGLICFAIQSRFEFNIPYEINITNTKVESQCDMYRLCSPNWNGQFEFNAAKNGGVASINVDCEYKPYQPYIHLNPNFDRLYGQDFNDARGLICSGDFSLTQTSDAWSTYERQNVNFQKTFDRQIQNMEVNNALQNIRTATQATLGTVGGAIGGLLSGGIGGAIVGGTASAIAGATDYALQKAQQVEAIDYTQDQFGYSLGNIKALPDSLTKVSAINNNNKLFPVLEYYTCTEEEKQALKDKIKYNGMTVMRIGTIREFLKEEPTYIKGKFIRLENFNEDFHFVNELANEFNKGVFI